MCLTAVGVEVPLCEGSCPALKLEVFCSGTLVHKDDMRTERLPVHAPLTEAMQAVLAQDRRRRGERRPLRLVLRRFHRWPFRFYAGYLPRPGLFLPDGELRHLTVRVWMELYDPLAFPVHFRLRGREPQLGPTGRLRWVPFPGWRPAAFFPGFWQVHEESDCGCAVRVTMGFGG